MTRSADILVLAVDGGGTRCRLAACRGGDVHRIEVGAANISTDFEAARAELMLGLDRLATVSGYSKGELTKAPAYLGLAGITGEAIARKLANALPLERVRIEDDRRAAMRGALGPKSGIVAHCGTGSFIAAQLGSSTRLAGGWGPILGDQASAQWVGRQAMADTLEAIDGVTEPSDMASALQNRFGDAAGIVRAAAEMTPSEFGAIAPVVTEYAGQGDALAVSILCKGADYLSDRMVKLGWVAGLPICLTGGIGPQYAPYLPAEMQAALSKPIGDPLSGAIALAHAFQEEIEDERC